MGKMIGGLFSNDSTVGRIMIALWIMIASNILFALVSLPVVTIGAGLAAVHYVMLKRLHRDSSLSPIITFWEGLKQNFKQGVICTVIYLALGIFLYLDIRFCNYRGGVLTYFKYALYAIGFFALILWIYLMPVMAAFKDTIPHLFRNALFFASKNPLKAVLLAAIWLIPMAVTYLDERMRPLYGFLWATCAVGILAAVTSRLLYKEIAEYLPADPDETEEDGQTSGGAAAARMHQKSERQVRKEQKKLDR